jgi:Smr domain/Pentatricopeptide repeat domain
MGLLLCGTSSLVDGYIVLVGPSRGDSQRRRTVFRKPRRVLLQQGRSASVTARSISLSPALSNFDMDCSTQWNGTNFYTEMDEREKSTSLHVSLNTRNDSDKLWSYVYNLQRARRNETSDGHSSEIVKVALSLATFLETHTGSALQPTKLQRQQRLSPQQVTEGHNMTTLATIPCASSNQDDAAVIVGTFDDCDIVEPLRRAVVQALRGVSTVNRHDYRLLLRLFQAARHYANDQPILDPSVARETILALNRTHSVNMNKIRTVWKAVETARGPYTSETPTNGSRGDSTGSTTCWTRPVGPLEVNAMVQTLVARGKLTAAFDLFHKEHEARTTDAYSLSILLNALTASLPLSTANTASSNGTAQAKLPMLHDLHHQALRAMLSTSPLDSWQWNTVVALIDQCVTRDGSTENASKRYWNNPALTALLQFNRRCAKTQSVRHNARTQQLVHWVLDYMKRHDIWPDQVTSTLILSSLDKTSWELAVALLRSGYRHGGSRPSEWSLPQPNVYMYSAAMAVCARSRQYNVTLKLLNEMQQKQRPPKSNDLIDTKPNIYVYNSILQAMAGTHEQYRRRRNHQRVKRKRNAMDRAQERLTAAMQLWQQMPVQPEIVTFNTLLSVIAGSTQWLLAVDKEDRRLEQFWTDLELRFPQLFNTTETVGYSRVEQLVAAVLNQMQQSHVMPDAITYKHAIRVVRNSGNVSSVLGLVRLGLAQCLSPKRSMHMATDVCSSGLSVLADVGDMDGVEGLLSLMRRHGITTLSSDGVLHVTEALANANRTDVLPGFLGAGASAHLGYMNISLPHLQASHFAAAITACLYAGDFESARQLLMHMQALGVRATQESLEAITRSYAILALKHDTPKSQAKRTVGRGSNPRAFSPPVRARSAFTLLSNIEHPSADLVSMVTKACCLAGMFQEVQSLLRLLHKRVLQHRSVEPLRPSFLNTRQRMANENEVALAGLHRELLRLCAEQGNVTNALRLCEDIQYLSSQLASAASSGAFHGVRPEPVSSQRGNVATNSAFGMTSSSWKSLIVAASKSGHWRVCLSSLQFLRPYLEATSPSTALNENELAGLTEDYVRLESTLNTVVKCLAVRSQYGWIVRVIDDWIEWSGRRPPREAVLAAIRILAARGRGQEVNNLLVRCTTMDSPLTKKADHSYKPMLFVGAISTLYKEGLYDEADDAFVAAISQQSLPFNLERQSTGEQKRITLDLHGMNVAVAHSAVRITLQQEAAAANWNGTEQWNTDMIIITGRGLNSVYLMRPVLRPSVQRMLVEEFYPPLGTTSIPGNMGAIRISAECISEWLTHQRQQKGARLLIVAAMLKNIASPSGRLLAALDKVTSREASDDGLP